jgi:hypothetical protein
MNSFSSLSLWIGDTCFFISLNFRRFTGYPFGRATQRYIIKTVENLVHVADPYCFQLIENCPIQKSIGPFFVDPLIRTSLESLVAPKASHEENLIWNGPISLNFCLTLFSTTGPPSCLFSAASRPVQLLLTPLASTPIQLLSSLSFSSIPPLLSHYSNAWIQNLLFGACSLVVRDVKLSEVIQTSSFKILILTFPEFAASLS